MDSKKTLLDYYRLSTEQALSNQQSTANGLSGHEAHKRLEESGPNMLHVARKESALSAYIRQFKDLMIALLLASSAISFYLGDLRASVVLLALVFFNTTIGYLQEYKAEKVMESLEKLVVNKASVMRDGSVHEIGSSEIVPGDVCYIEEGNSVPADLRVISEDELSTNDFALTGESNPSRKFTHAISGTVPLPGRQNLVYMGTTVATGTAYGVVIATGMQTELGRIASLSQDIDNSASPLQKEMNNIATRVTQGTVVLCAILLPVAIQGGLGIKDAFLFAIGIASSIIPQGLPAEINTSLAQAAAKLAKARALVKKLSAVETLGATSVIATDKTGTLTKNQMTVEEFAVGDKIYKVIGKGYEPNGAITTSRGKKLTTAELAKLELVFVTAALASNAHINPPDDEHPVWYCIGDPTEGALVTLGLKGGYDQTKLNAQYPELKEFAFDSARKRMASVRKYGKDGRLYVLVKGAPENVLEHCTSIWNHGAASRLRSTEREDILNANKVLATRAMRNLGLAYRVLPTNTKLDKLTMEEAESGLTWLGSAAMIDPLREDVPSAMEAARRAHIKVSIVTGDNAVTAKAIAIRARLTADPADIIVVAGEELAALSDAQVLELARKGGVIFSRVAPEDKLRIVKLVQQNGQVVAVTGDGINDAPALKRADIGVAMGQTGTDVAKQSSEIVLLDDSFHTLVGAVQEGRVIFQNIRKGTLSCFTSNAAELVVNLVSLAAATALHVPLALSVMQILAIDLIAELFPIAALGRDKGEGQLMHEYPRNPKHHILNREAILDLAWCGLLIGGLAFANYIWYYLRRGVEPQGLTAESMVHMQATTLTYLTIVLCQLTNILQRRSVHGLFTKYQLHNRQLWLSYLFSLFCVGNIIYNPWIAPYFRAGSLDISDWCYAFLAVAIFAGIREFHIRTRHHTRKQVLQKHREHHAHIRAAA